MGCLIMKVLFFLARWSNGGIEKNICNYLTTLENNKIEIYIAALQKDGELFDDILDKYKIKVLTLIDKGEVNKSNFERVHFLKETCQMVKPDIVHINISCGVAFMYSHIVKKYFPNIKVFVHGHSTMTEPPYIVLKTFYYNFFRILWEKTADYAIACSEEAGEYLFTKKRRESPNYKVLHCAIDTERCKYSLQERIITRQKLNIDERAIVIGTVGRFERQKNPDFIVEIIKELKIKNLEFRFLWIGEGDLKENIQKKISEYKLKDYVVFVNKTNNIPGILSAMDIFVLPSLYEGLSIVNIEAQASGLYNIVSSTITDEAKVSEKFMKLPIDDCECWANQIIKIINTKVYYDRKYPASEINKAGFDIKQNTDALLKMYYSCLRS